MNLSEHENRDDMKVWLSEDEVVQLLDAADGTEQQLAFSLAVRCGLRSHEVMAVRPSDVVDTDAGPMLRVWDGKGGKYRETPVPAQLKTQIDTIADVRDDNNDEPLLSIGTTRTLRQWIQDARESLHQDCEEAGWNYLSFHDLRRTWATSLDSKDVDTLIVCDWGGWNDLDTFLDDYRGTNSPEAQRRERGKVEWL